MGEKITTIYFDKVKVPDYPIDATYSLTSTLSEDLNCRIFIVHISINEKLRISMLKYLTPIQKIVLDEYKKSYPKSLEEISVGYSIFEFTKGIRFIFDLNMFSSGMDFKKANEKNYNMIFDGIVGVIPTRKKVESLVWLPNYVGDAYNIRLVPSYEEATKAIDNFVEKRKKKGLKVSE